MTWESLGTWQLNEGWQFTDEINDGSTLFRVNHFSDAVTPSSLRGIICQVHESDELLAFDFRRLTYRTDMNEGFLFIRPQGLTNLKLGFRKLGGNENWTIKLESLAGTTSVNMPIELNDVNGLIAALSTKSDTGHVHDSNAIDGLIAALEMKAYIGHIHDLNAINGLVAALSAKSDAGHTHDLNVINGLVAALSAKSDAGHTHDLNAINGLVAALTAKSDAGHTHDLNAINGLVAALTAKSDAGHTHDLNAINGLAAALGAKSNIGHIHELSNVSGLVEALAGKESSIGNPPWVDLVLASGWVNNGGTQATAQCRKFFNRLVELKGVMKKSTMLLAGEVVATLPVGYRPLSDFFFAANGPSGTARIEITAAGDIKIQGGNSGGFSLNCTFSI